MTNIKRRTRTMRTRSRRRGSIVILASLFLIVVFAFLAFSVDIGRITTTRAELQNAADAAAMAGARALLKSPGQARVAATNLAAENLVAHESVTLIPGQDVEIGTWDKDTATFTLLAGAGENDGNAVRVTCLRSAARGSSLRLFFASMLGSGSTDVNATATATLDNPICGRFVGIDEATISSGFTDSYDSSQGSYASQTPGAEGHICSNEDITVKAPVNGDASPGDGHFVATQSGGSVTGDTEPHPPKTYPPTNAGNASSVNDNDLIASKYWNGDKLSIASNKTVDFPGGTLYATSLSISGELRITGPTTIYVEEKIDISGDGLVNSSQLPSDLKIYLLDKTGKSSTVSGSANIYAVIYGPGVRLDITGGAAFFGAAIAKELKLTNSGGCHFDEAIDPLGDAPRIKLVQ